MKMLIVLLILCQKVVWMNCFIIGVGMGSLRVAGVLGGLSVLGLWS